MIGDAMVFHELSTGAEEREAERLRLALRIEHREQRGQHRDAGEIRDHHAHAGDLPELGHAAVGGRQERQEARSRRGGGERQRRAGIARGVHQRELEIVDGEAVGAVAHAELDAEIDAEADEQHRERDRDQVERPDHQEAERGRHRQPDRPG